MQGQLLHIPMLTFSQIKTNTQRKQFNEKICSRAAAPVIAPPAVPASAAASTLAPAPNAPFTYAWALLEGQRVIHGGPGNDAIKRAVCRYFQVTKLDLESARRTAAVTKPRQIAMWLARNLTTHSLPAIGRQFGGRDHTTVLAAVRKIDQVKWSDGQLQMALSVISAELQPETSEVTR